MDEFFCLSQTCTKNKIFASCEEHGTCQLIKVSELCKEFKNPDGIPFKSFNRDLETEKLEEVEEE